MKGSLFCCRFAGGFPCVVFALAVSLASAGGDEEEGKGVAQNAGPPSAVTPVVLCVKVARIFLSPPPPPQR